MSPPTRLLVALGPGPKVESVIAEKLPQVGWEYVARSSPESWAAVEAMLLGSVERDLGDFDLGSLTHLKFVQRLYTGMDGVPFQRFPPGVLFAGNIGAYAPFVSEHALALALAAARDLPRSLALVRAGALRPPPAQRLLWRRTAVILGYGEIGRAVAARLAGFETRIVGLNRSGKNAPGAVEMFPAARLVDAVREADFVFDTRPLTRETEGTITASVLEAMRPTAVYINVGRARTVNEEDLYRHLLSHPEFRAAFDPWWHEDFAHGRIEEPFPFASLPNFVGTPHSAGFAPGAEEHVLELAVANLQRFFAGEVPLHILDPREYDSASPPRL